MMRSSLVIGALVCGLLSSTAYAKKADIPPLVVNGTEITKAMMEPHTQAACEGLKGVCKRWNRNAFDFLVKSWKEWAHAFPADTERLQNCIASNYNPNVNAYVWLSAAKCFDTNYKTYEEELDEWHAANVAYGRSKSSVTCRSSGSGKNLRVTCSSY